MQNCLSHYLGLFFEQFLVIDLNLGGIHASTKAIFQQISSLSDFRHIIFNNLINIALEK